VIVEWAAVEHATFEQETAVLVMFGLAMAGLVMFELATAGLMTLELATAGKAMVWRLKPLEVGY
jgi:hypothetical protein